MKVILSIWFLSTWAVVTSSTANNNRKEGNNRNINDVLVEMWAVANGANIVKMLQDRMANKDPDVLEVDQYLRGTDFKTICDYMWTSTEYVNVS